MSTSNAPVRVLVVDDSPTIRRVVAATLQRAGHEVATAESGEQGLAEAKTFQPHIILLDFTMPAMNGVQFLRRLDAERAGADVAPVVLMCTRGDRVPATDGDLRLVGVVDTITKPFSPDALVAVVLHSLEQRRPPAIVAPPEPAAGDDEVFPAAFDDDDKTITVPVPHMSSVRVEKRDGPAHHVGKEFLALPGRHGKEFSLPAGVALCGDLTVIALPDVLQLLKFQGQTGLLVVDAAGLRFDMGIESGSVVALSARDPDGGPARRGDLLLGRYFVSAGHIHEAELNRHLATAGNGRPIGERLLAAGVISSEELRQAVGQQTQDLMVELLRARRGVFALSAGADRLPAVVVRPGWSVDQLMFEALRQIDEWGVIESQVPSFEARFAICGNSVDDSGLSAEEGLVLQALAAGPLLVRDLVKQSPLRPFAVCRMLYRLAILKRVQRLDDGDSSKLVNDEGLVPLLSTLPREAR